MPVVCSLPSNQGLDFGLALILYLDALPDSNQPQVLGNQLARPFNMLGCMLKGNQLGIVLLSQYTIYYNKIKIFNIELLVLIS